MPMQMKERKIKKISEKSVRKTEENEEDSLSVPREYYE